MRDWPEERPILPLVFEGVSYAVAGRVLLQDVAFRLEGRSCSVILGPNGAGKTLLLRLANGLLEPSRGRIRWLGPGGEGAARARALVFQRPVLLRRRAAANVEYALRLRGVEARERRRRTQRVLEATGLLELARHPARTLSVGLQHRLALARAWAVRPQVLFLDEPAASLDPAASRAQEAAIHTIREEGTKIVMTTHDLAQARRMADEVLFLEGGQLLEQTPASVFWSEPRSAAAKDFLRGGGI